MAAASRRAAISNSTGPRTTSVIQEASKYREAAPDTKTGFARVRAMVGAVLKELLDDAAYRAALERIPSSLRAEILGNEYNKVRPPIRMIAPYSRTAREGFDAGDAHRIGNQAPAIRSLRRVHSCQATRAALTQRAGT